MTFGAGGIVARLRPRSRSAVVSGQMGSRSFGAYIYIYIHMCVYIYIFLVGFQFVGVSGCLGLRRFGVVSVCHHATIDETGAVSGACFVADRCCDLKKPYLGL